MYLDDYVMCLCFFELLFCSFIFVTEIIDYGGSGCACVNARWRYKRPTPLVFRGRWYRKVGLCMYAIIERKWSQNRVYSLALLPVLFCWFCYIQFLFACFGCTVNIGTFKKKRKTEKK